MLEWAATLPRSRRLVHLSGYRVGGTGRTPDYPQGAYEASKVEADRALRARAAELGVPLTLVNPGTVIGPGQYPGLVSLLADLWHGRLRALPGGPDVFLPRGTLDHLARFLAEVPAAPAGEHHWVLDENTPRCPN